MQSWRTGRTIATVQSWHSVLAHEGLSTVFHTLHHRENSRWGTLLPCIPICLCVHEVLVEQYSSAKDLTSLQKIKHARLPLTLLTQDQWERGTAANLYHMAEFKMLHNSQCWKGILPFCFFSLASKVNLVAQPPNSLLNFMSCEQQAQKIASGCMEKQDSTRRWLQKAPEALMILSLYQSTGISAARDLQELPFTW